jgi:hypothetical protein
VKFWNDPSASASSNLVCDSGTPTKIGLTSGRFSIGLPDACATAVKGSPNLYVEVLVDPTGSGATSLGRTKISAVPYALEAGHATAADTATSATSATNATTAATANAAAGSLATTLSQLQAESHPTSGFHAWLTTNGPTLTPNSFTKVVFDHVEFDLNSEYDKTTGLFTPKSDGEYLIDCGAWFIPSGAGQRYTLGVFGGTTELSAQDLQSSSTVLGLSLNDSFITHLSAGEQVHCQVGSTDSDQLNSSFPERNHFSAMRLY